MVALAHWGYSPVFMKRTADVLALLSMWYFGSFFVWLPFLLAGGGLMSPQFRKVHPDAVTNYIPISITCTCSV